MPDAILGKTEDSKNHTDYYWDVCHKIGSLNLNFEGSACCSLKPEKGVQVRSDVDPLDPLTTLTIH